MKKIWFVGVLVLTLLNACSPSKNRITQSQSEKLLIEQSQVLVHIVFLKTKSDLTKEAKEELLKAIKAVEAIESVLEFSMGAIADTKDNRFISDHDLVFQIVVKNLSAYQQYQDHPIHLQLKAVAKDKLAAPPAVYDYWKNSF